MDNVTFTNNILLVEGLNVTHQSSYPVFILLLLVYVFTMGCNVALLILISMEKTLHHPMNLLFCNLPLTDIIGTSVIIPRLMRDILREPSERHITYVECVTQAYFVHLFAAASHYVLMIMAFDRYMAICEPLRYTAVMTNKMVVKLSALAWGISIVTVAILIGITLRLSRCRSLIENPFCDNASVFKLSCDEGVAVNNLYGICTTVLVIIVSIGSVLITYGKIAAVCRKKKNKSLNSKAITTCSTHIAVYLIMFFSCAIMVFFHRSPQHYESRKLVSIIFHILPPGLNPIVYGLQTKEIRQKSVKLCCKRKANFK